MTTEMTNEELSRAVAERMDKPLVCEGGGGTQRHLDTGQMMCNDCWKPVYGDKCTSAKRYNYATSMDACLAPGGPVEWLKKHPDLKYMGMYHDGGAFRWECEVFLGIREAMRHADTLPRALCLAFLAATEEA